MKIPTLHQSLQAKLGAYSGEHLTAAIRYQDRYGNLVYQGTSRNFNPVMAGAAKITIAEVDMVVDLGTIEPEIIVTPSIYVNRVVSREILVKGA